MAKPKKNKQSPSLSAATADRHVLYGLSVQNVEAEIDFVDDTFKDLRGRRAKTIREDFCGTANTSCEWVGRRKSNVAVGFDLDGDTLAWARKKNFRNLTEDQKSRVSLFERDVLEPGEEGRDMDAILAMNFSYWLLTNRNDLVAYFRSVREALKDDGVFFLDHYGGPDALKECEEERELDGFTYVWDQHKYNPIDGLMTCYIHFQFPDDTEIRKAFSYVWRHYTLPEVQDCLRDAGFRNVTVYWEGTDDDGDGDGVFTAATEGDADEAFITYVVAEK